MFWVAGGERGAGGLVGEKAVSLLLRMASFILRPNYIGSVKIFA